MKLPTDKISISMGDTTIECTSNHYICVNLSNGKKNVSGGICVSDLIDIMNGCSSKRIFQEGKRTVFKEIK